MKRVYGNAPLNGLLQDLGIIDRRDEGTDE
jgi:hypothetical protein